MKTQTFLIVFATAAVLWGCSSCGSGGNGADTDTGSESESEIDTDWDGGPLTPCEGDPPEGMVCVPGGTYLMGCMPYDIYCEEDELPLVEVTLSPFWVDVYETTYEELLPFLNTLKAGYVRGPGSVGTEGGQSVWFSYVAIGLSDEGDYYWNYEGCDPGIEAAAGGLSQLGARMYCEWLGKQLPTEAQWEAAARGQTALVYPCAWEHLACWYGRHGCVLHSYLDAECFTDECCVPVHTDSTSDCPSQWGAIEMCGNAAEWVLDRKDEINGGHAWCAEGCTDPEPRDGAMPIIKGGGTMSSLPETRISSRVTLGFVTQSQEDRDTGVRCVLPADGRAEKRSVTHDRR
jgi:formylglycine-generating enzyme required for sulfatase activity